MNCPNDRLPPGSAGIRRDRMRTQEVESMRCTKVTCIPLIFLLLALLACGNSQETARMKLGQMNVNYNEDTFVERVRDGDILAVRLFLQAGMNPNTTNKDGESALGVAARFRARGGGTDAPGPGGGP